MRSLNYFICQITMLFFSRILRSCVTWIIATRITGSDSRRLFFRRRISKPNSRQRTRQLTSVRATVELVESQLKRTTTSMPSSDSSSIIRLSIKSSTHFSRKIILIVKNLPVQNVLLQRRKITMSTKTTSPMKKATNLRRRIHKELSKSKTTKYVLTLRHQLMPRTWNVLTLKNRWASNTRTTFTFSIQSKFPVIKKKIQFKR